MPSDISTTPFSALGWPSSDAPRTSLKSRTPVNGDTFVVRPTLLHRVLIIMVLGVMPIAMSLFFIYMATETPMLSIFAAVFFAMFSPLCLLFLRSLITTRIEARPVRVNLRMSRMRGPVPLLGTIRAEFPYTAVAAVETREEVYNGCGITSLHRAYSVVTRAGVRISLGSMDQNRGFQLPFDQAAARIAARAGISVTDRGTVLVGGILRAIANDSLPWSAQALSPAEREAWRRRAILTAWLLLMAVAGILFLRFFAG